jgi:serine/threonine protein phosphatase PrpC
MMCELLRNPDGSQRAFVAGVFDGHGLLGERAAKAAAETLREICQDPKFDPNKFIANAHEEMRRLFARLQEAVLAQHERERIPDTYEYPGSSSTMSFEIKSHPVFAYAYSAHPMMPPAPIDFGCTAVVAVVCSGMLCVGNAGDAGAFLCVPNSAESVRVLSERHNAKEQAEVDRIERDFADKARITPDGYLAPLDPNICQYEVQTTRCLGHKLLRAAGITSDPTITVSPLREARALILCSDGVSDELQPRDIADRVVDAGSAEEAAQALCRDAQDFCMDQDHVDDCTVVVVRFSHARLVAGASHADQSAVC